MSRRKQTKPLRLNEDDPQQQNGEHGQLIMNHTAWIRMDFFLNPIIQYRLNFFFRPQIINFLLWTIEISKMYNKYYFFL